MTKTTTHTSEQQTLRQQSAVLNTPEFYQKFSCIGAECENNCCVNWNITTTREDFNKLKKHDDIKVRQIVDKKSQSCGKGSPFYRKLKLDVNGRCPFLTTNSLCYLQKNHGEGVQPTTCKAYPRNDKFIQGEIFESLSLSCPEAARKILLSPSAMNVSQVAVNADTKIPDFLTIESVENSDLLHNFKHIAYQCILAGNADTVEARLFNLAMLFSLTNERINKGESLDSLLRSFEEYLISGQLNEMYTLTPTLDDNHNFVLQELLYAKDLTLGNNTLLDYKMAAIDILKKSNAYNDSKQSIDLTNFHAQFCHSGYAKLIDSHGHAFINLMLHWIYNNAFDLTSSGAIFKQFSCFVLTFYYTRMLCGVLNESNKTDNESAALLVGVIHSISRRADHGRHIIDQIYHTMATKNLTEPEHIFSLIKID